MKENIARIETVEGMGTGVLYPCGYEENIEGCSGYNSFIIFTNHHVLSGVGEDTKPEEDIRDSILLELYDDAGNCIDKSDIKRVLVCNPPGNLHKHDDIAALLVCIDSNRTISLETGISREGLQNRDILYMEGYPGVMADDEVSPKVQLQGMAKSIFPENDRIGVYQIKDDYHWYNDFKDLKLMQGFSGSPVYIEREGRTYLLGINQSVADAGSGENPFKLVYYLKIKSVLEFLRQSGCILFRRDSEYTYQVEWVYGLEQRMREEQRGQRKRVYVNKPTLLLIGGSGAGKSSFAKDFAYNGKKLHTTNDGQTTRTNVIYEYSIFCPQSAAEIKFMNQEKFLDFMWKRNGVRPILFFCQRLFGLGAGHLPENKREYLTNCYYLLECIKNDWEGSRESRRESRQEVKTIRESKPGNGLKIIRETCDRIEDMLIVSQDNKAGMDDEELFEIYQNVMGFLLSTIPVEEIRFICDKGRIDEIRELCRRKLEYEKTISRTEPDWKKREAVFGEIIKKKWPELEQSRLRMTLMEYCMPSAEMRYKDYQKKCYEVIRGNFPEGLKERDRKKQEALKALISDMKFREDLFDILFSIEGFFNLHEFDFLGNTEDLKERVCKISPGILEFSEETQSGAGRKDIEIETALKHIYTEVHRLLKEALIQRYGVSVNLSHKIILDQMTKDEEEFLMWCVQEKNGNSLTGMVDYVKIVDKVSDEYAMLLKELKISSLRILDTYGLDHVEGGRGTGDILHDIVYKYQEDIKIRLEDIFVIYLKKLDSGRPDELRHILPYVWEVIPQTSVYCVFTGIDIFYHNADSQLGSIKWNKSNEKNCPKSVRYLLSDKGKEEITRNVVYSRERKEYLYLVLRNNLIPYCGRKELVEKHYGYYSNNYFYLRKLLSSMILKESSSLEIVDEYSVKEKLKANRPVVERLLDQLFEKASVRIWNFHHMTVKANYDRLTKRKKAHELGFWRTFRHQWNQLFHEAYSYVIREESGEFIGLFENERAAIEAALANMETRFLGESGNLYKMDYPKRDKNQFRLLLEKMYEHQEVYGADNPFKPDCRVIESLDQEREYLNNVTDFAKGFRRIDGIRNEYVEFFITTFLKQINEDNNTKSENLVSLNPFFSDALDRLEQGFIDKYEGNDSGAALKKFKTILRYYLNNHYL